MKSLFITVEGIDGAGKTTHVSGIRNYFDRRGRKVVSTREPGGTSVGEALRAVLLGSEHPIHPETEALLMFAARREHLARVIVPALGEGSVVICDRFTDATFAYQGWGRGVDLAKLEIMERSGAWGASTRLDLVARRTGGVGTRTNGEGPPA